ncbi:ABC transporter permease [Alkaliphilus oremlandii]|uniref:ABC3 transporter permease C-terminal domain-containing protein n=1 Tax=Alkaliphilus oremlandii (strain OhILAs) TaxID=350688 RepID=A8MFZ0_ALKOO|nr:ABC transporter permease [Alkaliphilus oremlandii]ABW18528.1 protein of unknown function DUF214 [Alkaliphilus oremlandii OhILAs]
MFFDFIKRNSSKTRKENGIYFLSLIISIVAFYVILSLGDQDVMMYLKTIESQAVGKLMALIPLLYTVSIFFVFFLVYFANRYQLQLRSKEFGMYLMMGMKRSKLFAMILGETLWNSFISLAIGIPISIFLTQIISLVTSRIIGMGIIGYNFRISWIGLGLTLLGFLIVQLGAMMILSMSISKKEPYDLIHDEKEEVQSIVSSKKGWVHLILGTILILVAYGLGIRFLRGIDFSVVAAILLTGIMGTFLFFKGVSSFISRVIRRKSHTSTGLYTFTARQIQENVLHNSSSIAISSLLILMSMMSFAYGIATITSIHGEGERSVDFTFEGEEKEIISVLESDEMKPYIESYFPMKMGNLYHSEGETNTFSWAAVVEQASKEKDSVEKENLMRDLSYDDSPYLISVSSYNHILQSIGKEPVLLEENQMAMYSSSRFPYNHELLRKILKEKPSVTVNEETYELTKKLYTTNLVADRSITIMYGLIVPDALFNEVVEREGRTDRWNMILEDDFIKEEGLMQSINKMDQLLNPTGLHYESYLASMGRQLFYVVAGSYTTIYLGLMFLIIANTVLGLKFLMQQRTTRHRYSTLLMLGASVKELCLSARKQIVLYFTLVIAVALISSIFGIWSLMGSFFIAPNAVSVLKLISLVILSLGLFSAFELAYIWMIQRKSDEEIKKLSEVL